MISEILKTIVDKFKEQGKWISLKELRKRK